MMLPMAAGHTSDCELSLYSLSAVSSTDSTEPYLPKTLKTSSRTLGNPIATLAIHTGVER